MRIYPGLTLVKVEQDHFDSQWSVFVANDPFNSWLNVPVTFPTQDAAQRIASALRDEIDVVTTEYGEEEEATPMEMKSIRKVSELRAGDRTRWYEVRENAEPDPTQPGIYRVLVRHFDCYVTDYVRGEADETVLVVNTR